MYPAWAQFGLDTQVSASKHRAQLGHQFLGSVAATAKSGGLVAIQAERVPGPRVQFADGLHLARERVMVATRSSKVDGHVGRRIRERRNALGMSQEKLAAALGISFQQIQKYEVGANRVAASRLWNIAKALEVDISYFFEGIQKRAGRVRKPSARRSADAKTVRRKGGLGRR